jgi:DNA modification methylase
MRSIVLGDTFEELLKIESNSIDLILTDPPYFISRGSGFKSGKSKKYNIIDIDFGEWDKGSFDLDFLFREYYRVLKKGKQVISTSPKHKLKHYILEEMKTNLG